MATWPINELSGLLDPDVFVPGYTPTGTDVGAEIAQVLNKTNDVIEGANDLNTRLDTEVTAGNGRDVTLDSHAILIQAALTASDQNTNDVGILNIHATGDGSDHSDVAQNTADIATLNSLVGTGQFTTSIDILDMDFSTYGGYRQIVMINDSAKKTVVLQDPDGDWPEGREIFIVCRSTKGITVESSYFSPEIDAGEFSLCDGDSVRLTCVDVTGSYIYKWNAVLMPRADRANNVKELTAEEDHKEETGFTHKTFVVSGQGSGELATVTMPEITSDTVGTELKGYLHGSTGDGLKFLCSGTDQVLDNNGDTGDFIIVDGSTGQSIVTLTALPAIGGVYYWGASMPGADS